jgi:carbonic anhydrase/acetyltransferase-like protein (isoleucine patch superfamily)
MHDSLGSAHASILPFKGIVPQLGKNVLICDGVRIIGDVQVGDDSGLWFNAVLRGDVFPIKIGTRTNIQDGSILHVTTDTYALSIGDDVTVGHNAILHGATIGNRCLIGMGAIVLDAAVIGDESIVAAGSVVKQGMIIPSGVMVAGIPAKIIRDVKPEERQGFIDSAEHYREIAEHYRQLYGQS